MGSISYEYYKQYSARLAIGQKSNASLGSLPTRSPTLTYLLTDQALGFTFRWTMRRAISARPYVRVFLETRYVQTMTKEFSGILVKQTREKVRAANQTHNDEGRTRAAGAYTRSHFRST